MAKQLCRYGYSTYWLTDDKQVCVTGQGETDPKKGRIVYGDTPIKSGYSEFMPKVLADAMSREGLFY